MPIVCDNCLRGNTQKVELHVEDQPNHPVDRAKLAKIWDLCENCLEYLRRMDWELLKNRKRSLNDEQ